MSASWKQDWTEDQLVFIDKLSKMDNAFNEIFAKDRDGLVIGYEERSELEKLRRKNKKILDKLQKQEFTVAVVGLEKAGKSTLGNALIKKDMLPEYTERCTYTTTEIRAGSEDFAEVHFYTYEEFQDKFQKMLSAVKYENEAEFYALERSAFDRFWNAMEDKEPEIFQVHNGTTVEDIRTMLDGKNTIRNLLGKPPRKFTSEENEELQLYITGLGSRHSEGFMERTAHPYAVKDVVIQSTQLQEMEHVVLYDVPGFDSPTQLHKKQTEDMLKEADAIILVTNAAEPSLKGTQLDMLRKSRDEDDVKLSAKVFVFGNKIDTVRSKQIAEDNKATLRNEAVNKYMLALDGRVIVGSAKSYLEQNGIFSKDDRDRGAAGVSDKLNEWGLDSGVDKLKQKMMEYYTNDRYVILKQRAEKTLERAENYLNEILEKYSPEVLSRMDDPGTEHVVHATFALRNFVEEANEILKRHSDLIQVDRPFSKMIEENIDDIFPHINEDSEALKSIERKGAIYNSSNYPVTRVDAELRELLKTEFRKSIVEATARRTKEEQQNIRKELVETLLRIVGMKENSPYKEELEKSVNELFDTLLIENGEECRFNSLVERFTSSLIQAVITCPFGKPERYTHVTGDMEIAEFISLAAYYQSENASNDLDSTIMQRRIFAQILAHEYAPNGSRHNNNDESETLQGLSKFFEENKEILNKGAELAINLLPMGRWAKLLLSAGVKLGVLSKLSQMFNNRDFQIKWQRKSASQKQEFLDDFVKRYCEKNNRTTSDTSSNMPDETMPLTEFIAAKNQIGHEEIIKTKEDMLAALNTDIDILRDLTLHAVIWAIGLERAYNSVIEKNVELIRQGVQTRDELMGEWLKQNIRKILEDQFAAIVNEQAKNESRRLIVESIKNVLNSVSHL